MVTPTKRQIYEEAKRLFAQYCVRSGQPIPNNPEYDELLEDGFVSQAQCNLMSHEETLYGLSKIPESEKRGKSGKIEPKPEKGKFSRLLQFDIGELLKSGAFICGTSGSGKSDLAMYVADALSKRAMIYVVDPSQDWMRRSNVPFVVTVPKNLQVNVVDLPTIFDTSRLDLADQQEFVERLCSVILKFQIHQPEALRKWRVVIFEESQLIYPEGSFRSYRKSSSLQLVSIGRNYKVRFVAITPFSANVDKMLVKMTSQRWFGSTSEYNDLRYLKGFLGQQVSQLTALQNGEFLYHFPKEKTLKKIAIKPHKRRIPLTRLPYSETNRKIKKEPSPTLINETVRDLGMLLGFIGLALIFVASFL